MDSDRPKYEILTVQRFQGNAAAAPTCSGHIVVSRPFTDVTVATFRSVTRVHGVISSSDDLDFEREEERDSQKPVVPLIGNTVFGDDDERSVRNSF